MKYNYAEIVFVFVLMSNNMKARAKKVSRPETLGLGINLCLGICIGLYNLDTQILCMSLVSWFPR